MAQQMLQVDVEKDWVRLLPWQRSETEDLQSWGTLDQVAALAHSGDTLDTTMRITLS